MNLGEIKTIAKAQNPTLKNADDMIEIFANNAVIDIAAYTACLKSDKKIDITASQDKYSLSEKITDYLVMDESGVWWNNGSKWVPLDPETRKWFDDNQMNWRDLAAGTPKRYMVEGDQLIIVPKPLTLLAEGLWIYYGKMPEPMEEDGHYPFSGSATVLPYLRMFDPCILSYIKWQISPMLNKGQESEYYKNQYIADREEKFSLFKRKPYLSSASKMTPERP